MRNWTLVFGSFLWGLLCCLLGLSCEWAGQAAVGAGHWLMATADRLQDYAFKVGVWD